MQAELFRDAEDKFLADGEYDQRREQPDWVLLLC